MARDLESKVDAIAKKHKRVGAMLEQNPSLRGELVSSYRKASEESKGLYGFAKFIDYVRKPLGVLKLAGNLMGPGVGFLASGIARIGELALFTLPYSIYYAAKGGSLKNVGKVVGTELGKIVVPYGDVANFVPVYTHTANQYAQRQAAEDFLAKMEKRGVGQERRLEDVIEEQPIPDEHRRPAKIHSLAEARRRKRAPLRKTG